MLPIYYIAFVAQTEVAAKMEIHHRVRADADRNRPLTGIQKLATQTYAAVTQFVENVRVELQNWLDSQSACVPGSPILADC